MAAKYLVDLGRFLVDVLRSHSGTPHFVGLLYTSHRSFAETFYLATHNSLRDIHQCSRRDSNRHPQQATGRRPTP